MRLKRRSSSRRANSCSRRGDWQGGVRGGGRGAGGGGGGGGEGWRGEGDGRWSETRKGGGRGRVEGVSWGRGGVGGGVEGGRGEGEGGGAAEVCVLTDGGIRIPEGSTPLRAGSASSMKNKTRGPPPPCGLSRARFLGAVKGGKKGGFTWTHPTGR